MKDIFLNLFAFHVVTADFVPFAPKSKATRAALCVCVLGLFCAAQALLFLRGKCANLTHPGREPNYFEVLGFSHTQPSKEEIEAAYTVLNRQFNPANNPDPEALPRFRRVQEAYDCLRVGPCRVQYKKFGNYVQDLGGEKGSGQPNDAMNSTDWRVAASVAFYVTFALLAASMASVEVSLFNDCVQQKNGLRYALALAVVFCLNEIQWLSEVRLEHEEG